jgi:hypothetical protein
MFCAMVAKYSFRLTAISLFNHILCSLRMTLRNLAVKLFLRLCEKQKHKL